MAVSTDAPEALASLQEALPATVRLASDAGGTALAALGLVHAGAGPDGGDIAHPATFVVDAAGTIRWSHVARDLLDRPAPGAVLDAWRAASP